MKITSEEKLAKAIAKITAPKENSNRLRNVREILQLIKKGGYELTDEAYGLAERDLFGIADPSQEKEKTIMLEFIKALPSLKYLKR
jgi:hypothetical protein